MSVKYLDIKEFREFGYLFGVNRAFFHPRGLALEIQERPAGWPTDDQCQRLLGLLEPETPDLLAVRALMTEIKATPARWALTGIWDYRDDPEGIIFDRITADDVAKHDRLIAELERRRPAREAALGYWQQPVVAEES